MTTPTLMKTLGFVFGFNGQNAIIVNDLIIGLAIALLAFGYSTAYERTRGLPGSPGCSVCG
ncbi:MAG: hypothetical protein QOH91_2785 [Mycobacterium sp.]|nr:hypothetical protein [Mycobacterium sp.]